MIAFSCSHCGTKLTVKPEFAGRSSKCPNCKQPLTVPRPLDRAQAYVPSQHIEGTSSSVAEAGCDGGVTLGHVGPAPRPGQRSIGEVLAGQAKKGQRYLIEGEIARGGMGAVLRAIDCDIRREVAVKFMLDQADAGKKARFVEEAQITGQLEHPNIVPIHELGVDSQKRLYFSMKMVRGRSLAQVLDELRQNPRQAEKEWSLTKLLNNLVGVCNALAYAHARGVVHRDLKPANIMLGDFGEVYVMDWGLAKVMSRRDEAAPIVAGTVVEAASPAAASITATSAHSSKVLTNRGPEADLTQDGAVVGTPVYMPPEQALGRISDVEQRSDVYSLSAILYEILTMQPPVDKEGGYMAVLMRVGQGEIQPPEARASQRAKAGKIPKELAAVAMKGLAREKGKRYSTVEELRKDIELYLEGRSVSAKQDSKRELIWKFAKRNRGFSAGVVMTLLVLLVSLGLLFQAWQKTKAANAKSAQDQEAREKLGRDSVPSFVRAARALMAEENFGDAMAQANVAINFEPNEPEAHLVKGQLLIGEQRYAEALAELEICRKLKPEPAGAAPLVELCRKARSDHTGNLMALAEELARQKAYAVSARVTNQAEALRLPREQQLVHYRNKIEAAWPRQGYRLTVDDLGQFNLNCVSMGGLVDLKPLQGMKLTMLDLRLTDVRDLRPLKGMPLHSLNLGVCRQIQDLEPLQGMPLTFLSLTECSQVRNLTPLKDMPLTSLNLGSCKQVHDLTPLKGMPLTALYLSSCSEVRDLTVLKGMKLTTLELPPAITDQDLKLLRDLPLTHLSFAGCYQVHDLTPLMGMKLTLLFLPGTVTDQDLKLLRSMPLRTLRLDNCQMIRDLTPLQGLKLTTLVLHNCARLQDLTPLQGMKLHHLDLDICTQVENLAPLKDMPLTFLNLSNCAMVKDLTPLKDMPLAFLDLGNCRLVKDLTPLEGMNLRHVTLPPTNNLKGLDVIRRMRSLEIVTVDGKGSLVEEFRKRFDAGEFK